MSDKEQPVLPLVASIFVNKYRLDSVLGEGGFARVYGATDLAVKRSVAIKVLMPTADVHDRTAARFLREMRVVARLSGPHVVRMFDFGRTDDGLMYMVFEFLGGTDLDEYIGRGRMMANDVVHVLRQVLNALTEAHALGLLHRDVKPGNIRVYEYMDDPLRVKLLDFGIARSSDGDSSLTATGMVVGTPRFMAPEQLFGEPLTPATDLYSLALVAFEMLTGRPSDHMRLVANNLRVELTEADAVARPLREIINRMLAREPADRFASALAVSDALDRMNATPSAVVRAASPAPTETVGAPPARDRPWAPWLVLGAGFLVGVLAIAVVTSPADTVETRRVTPRRVPMELLKSTKPAPAARVDAPATGTDIGTEIGPEVEGRGGCGLDPPFVGSSKMAQVRGLDRLEWAVHVPRGYDPEHNYPVMLLFHDDTSSGPEVLFQTGLGETADRHQFVVIAPSDADVVYVWSDDSDIERAQLTLDITADRLCLDTKRVFAVGHGSGNSGVQRLACSNLIRGAVFASHILTSPRLECARPMPMLWVGPTKTGFQPVDGGPDCTGTNKISYDVFESLWRERNACSNQATTFAKHGNSRCRAWDCADAPFVSCRVDGGRAWPGAPLRTVDVLKCDGPASKFPQNEVIWQFMESLY